MLKLIRTLRRLKTIRDKAPHISISQFGQLTSNPKVAVSLSSRGGSMTVYVHADDDAGNAAATLNASSLENILGLPVADQRAAATNEADSASTLTGRWHRLPRELAGAPVPATV